MRWHCFPLALSQIYNLLLALSLLSFRLHMWHRQVRLLDPSSEQTLQVAHDFYLRVDIEVSNIGCLGHAAILAVQPEL